MSRNMCILHGFVGKDAELKKTTTDTEYARFSLATTESWKDKQGNKQSKTEWHQIVVWGAKAKVAADHFKKGTELDIMGKIEYQQVEDKDSGKKITYTTIKLIDFDFCGKRGDNGGYSERPEPEQSGYQKDENTDSDNSGESSGGSSSTEDDIPF